MKKIYLFLVILLTVGEIVYAGSVGTSGAAFLKVLPGVRAQAMGGAYGALAEGISGMHWNPAGLAFSSKREFSAMYMRWLDDINYGFLGYGYPVGSNISLGLSGIYLMTEVEGRDILGQKQEDIKFNNFAGTINLSYLLSENISWGVNVKYVQEDITSEKAKAYAFDIGNIYTSWDRKFQYGVSAQNLGGKIGFEGEKDNLPLNFKIGFAVFPFENRFIFACDANFPNDNKTRFNFGIEYKPVEILALRTGYRLGYDQKGFDAMSFGLGFVTHTTESISGSLDLAYLPYGELGNTYKVAYTIQF